MELELGPIEIPSFLSQQPRLSLTHKEELRQYLEQERGRRRQAVQHSFTSRISPKPLLSPSREDFMHNELRDPDYEKLSHIYETHVKAPDAVQQRKPRIPRSSSTGPSRKKSVDQLIQEKEEKIRQECTFSPRINKVPHSYTERRLSSRAKLELLATPKAETMEKRERLKRLEEEKEKAQCTFRPNAKRRSLSATREVPVELRLYEEASLKHKEREKYVKQVQDAQFSQFPFRPQVQATNRSLDRPPIYVRASEVQQEKEAKLRRLKEEKEPDYSFQPKINPLSVKLAEVYRSKQNSVVESEPESITSEPSRLFTKNDGPSFFERQRQMQERLQARKKALKEQQEFSFKPAINCTSKYICDSVRYNESFTDKVERWSDEAAAKRLEKQKSIEKQQISQYKFEPQINPLSKQLGRNSSIEKLSCYEKPKPSTPKAPSFTPLLNKKKQFLKVQSDYKQGKNISNIINSQQRMKEDRIEKEMRSKEFEQMKHCTFNPELSANTRVSPQNVNIRGMNRFMELKDMAKQQGEDKKKREDKAFLTNSNFVPPFPHTVPTPFTLHTSRSDDKLQKLKAEIEETERTLCTFQPKKQPQFLYSNFQII